MKTNRDPSSLESRGRWLQYAAGVLFLITIAGASLYDHFTPSMRDLDDGDYRGTWRAIIVLGATAASVLIFGAGTWLRTENGAK